MAKYVLIKKQTEQGTLYQVQATKSFTTLDGRVVKKGELGGYVQSSKVLSQHGRCWIEGNAYALGESRISGDALVSATHHSKSSILLKDAHIQERALIADVSYDVCYEEEEDVVFNELDVFEKTEDGNYLLWRGSETLITSSTVCGDATVKGYARISDSTICDRAMVEGYNYRTSEYDSYNYIESYIYDSCVGGNAHVDSADICNSVLLQKAVAICELVSNEVVRDNWRK